LTRRAQGQALPESLLIVEPIGQRAARGDEGGKLAYQQMLDFTEDQKRANVLMATSSLTTAATRLQRPQAALAACHAGTARAKDTGPT
jgi:hypothetical protein